MLKSLISRPLRFSGVAAAAAIIASGCETLTPHQLWKLNRGSDMDRGDAYFSIPSEPRLDETPATTQATLEAPEPTPARPASR